MFPNGVKSTPGCVCTGTTGGDGYIRTSQTDGQDGWCDPVRREDGGPEKIKVGSTADVLQVNDEAAFLLDVAMQVDNFVLIGNDIESRRRTATRLQLERGEVAACAPSG